MKNRLNSSIFSMYFSLFKGTKELLPGVILVTHRLAILLPFAHTHMLTCLGELHVLA